MKARTAAFAATVGLFSLSVFGGSTQPTTQLAFPGAEGFGALATGGRGGQTVHVKTLDDAGPGSFREAISASNRTVVFDVGGVITLKSPLTFPSNITVAGQTAPGEGVTVFGNASNISGQSNIILRYVRFRAGMGSARGAKTLGVNASHNIILDHLSISWGRWDNTGMTARPHDDTADGKSHDITLQNCIVSEGVDPQRFGALIDDAINITVARTLWADNNSRSPKAKGLIQVINDVVYNWEVGGIVGGHSAADWHQDLINNLFIAGPSSKGSFLPMYTHTDHVYRSGNMVDLDRDGQFNPRPVDDTDYRGNGKDEAPTFMPEVYNHPPVPVTILSVKQAYNQLLADAGDSLHRDAIDRRIIDQVTSLGTKGAIIRDEKEVGGIQPIAGGAAPVDTDGDGIPDAWESAHHLDAKNPADAAQVDEASGYTNLELYFNSLVPAHPVEAAGQ